MAIVAIEFWSNNNAVITVNSAVIGFQEFFSIGPVAAASGGFVWLKMFKKSIPAGEGSTWSFAFSGGSGVWSLGHSVSFLGADTSPTNIEDTDSASGTGTATPSTSVTVATLAALVHFISRAEPATQSTAPTGFTVRQSGNVLNTNTNVPAATGTHSASGGVISVSTTQLAALIALKPLADEEEPVQGTLVATLPQMGAFLTGEAISEGVMTPLLQMFTAALQGAAVAELEVAVELPAMAAGLSAEAYAALVLQGGLPALEAALASEAVGAGELAATLPVLEAFLDSETVAGGVLFGALPALEAALTGFFETSDNFSGLLPAMETYLSAEAYAIGEIVSFLPAMEAALTAEEFSSGTIAAEMPSMEATLFSSAPIFLEGELNAVLPVLIMMSRRGIRLMKEFERQRKVTRDFIMASPTYIALIPAGEFRTAGGGIAVVDQVARPVQTLRKIPMSHTERPEGSSSGIAGTGGGVQRKYDMTLLGEWDAVIREGDSWIDEDGQHYVVDALVPFNGYQVKALVMSYGRRAKTYG